MSPPPARRSTLSLLRGPSWPGGRPRGGGALPTPAEHRTDPGPARRPPPPLRLTCPAGPCRRVWGRGEALLPKKPTRSSQVPRPPGCSFRASKRPGGSGCLLERPPPPTRPAARAGKAPVGYWRRSPPPRLRIVPRPPSLGTRADDTTGGGGARGPGGGGGCQAHIYRAAERGVPPPSTPPPQTGRSSASQPLPAS